MEPHSENYLKKLFGNERKIEGALKKLDMLAQEEARMASAQLLKATHVIDHGVANVDNELFVDYRVAGVDERVAGVGERVARVDAKLSAINGKQQNIRGLRTAFMPDMQTQSS